jgi:anti-anti-sigma factor
MTDFTATLRTAPGVTVIDLAGLLDRSAETGLTTAFETALRSPDGPITLNFGAVEYINSTGIALVVSLLARAVAAGRVVRAFGLTPHYREIFTITRLSDFMGIYDDEAAAGATASS